MTSPGQPQPPDASGREERLDDVGPAENRRLCYGTSSFMSRAVSSVTFSKHCGRHCAISRRAQSHEVFYHRAARHEDDEAFAQICNGKIENILTEVWPSGFGRLKFTSQICTIMSFRPE